MAGITIQMGDAFLISTPPSGAHLYIAIAPTADNRYLFINVTTRRRKSESVCILMPGPDVPPFIKKESVVAYKYALELSPQALALVVMPNSPIPKGVVSASVLKQI